MRKEGQGGKGTKRYDLGEPGSSNYLPRVAFHDPSSCLESPINLFFDLRNHLPFSVHEPTILMRHLKTIGLSDKET